MLPHFGAALENDQNDCRVQPLQFTMCCRRSARLKIIERCELAYKDEYLRVALHRRVSCCTSVLKVIRAKRRTSRPAPATAGRVVPEYDDRIIVFSET